MSAARAARLAPVLTTLLLVGTVVYGGAAAGLYAFQENLIYFPARELERTPASAGLAFEETWLETDDGARIHGWYVPGDPQAPALLFLHGNAGNISHRVDSLVVYHRLGLNTLIIDYRGYGESDGKPGEEATYRDAEAAWAHLTGTRGFAPDQVVVLGRSLGSGVAAGLAARRPVGALVLESAFTSLTDLGAELYPLFPVRWLSRVHYPTRDRLPSIEAPVLLVHSPHDELVPYAHALALGAAAPRARLLEIAGGHNDGFLTSGERYSGGLRSFLADAGLL